MKVALVHEMLVKMGGAERVLSAFCEMFPDAPIFTLLYDEKACGQNFPKEKIRTSRLQKYADWKIPRQFLVGKMPTEIEAFDFSEFDIVISSSSAFAHGIIVPVNTLHICYCHSPMRYAWDYTHEYVQEKGRGSFGFMKRLLIKNLLSFLRIWDISAAGRPDIVLANSQTTKSRIEKYWRRDDAIIVYPPVEQQRFSLKEETKDYFLIVSALQGFKRIDIAVEAFSRMPEKRLIIVGEGSERKNLEKSAGENIEFLGRKTDKEVVALLQNCRAFIFPGLEDFGIAPVEAMFCGKPVIAYKKGGVTESVLDGETGIFFEEQTPDSLCSAMEKFVSLEATFRKNTSLIRKHAENFGNNNFYTTITRILKGKGIDF
jgi:glycosyltransferase involved in cell wall biosynthesis